MKGVGLFILVVAIFLQLFFRCKKENDRSSDYSFQYQASSKKVVAIWYFDHGKYAERLYNATNHLTDPVEQEKYKGDLLPGQTVAFDQDLIKDSIQIAIDSGHTVSASILYKGQPVITRSRIDTPLIFTWRF